MANIEWQDFEKVELVTGTIVRAKPFPEAIKPAFIIEVDLGEKLGVKKSSAQITHHYSIGELIGKQVVCVTNFPPKQIGKIMSEVLITGFPDKNGQVILCTPDKRTPNGAKLY